MRFGCWNCAATEGCEGCEDFDGEDDLGDFEHEPDPGCVLGDRCVNPRPYHQSWECATAEDMETYYAAAEQEAR